MKQASMASKLSKIIMEAGGKVISSGRDEQGHYVVIEADGGTLADKIATTMAFDDSVLEKLLKVVVVKASRMKVPLKVYLADDDLTISDAVEKMVVPMEKE